MDRFRVSLLVFGCLLNLAIAGVIQSRRQSANRPLTPEEFKKSLTALANPNVDDSEASNDPDLFEGDIVLPEGGEAELRETHRDDNKKWPKSDDGMVYVPYEIPDYFSEEQRLAIARTVLEYQAKTCIRMIPHIETDNYPDPHIMFSSEYSRYTSPIGVNKYTVNRIDIRGWGLEWGRVTHEVMHTLGFFHEHTRLDRDNYIRVNWDQIDSHREQYESCKWIPTLHAGCRAATTNYDYGSIMHYSTHSIGWDGKEHEVMTPLKPVPAGVTIGQRTELSPLDVEGIRDFYGCAPGSHDSSIVLS